MVLRVFVKAESAKGKEADDWEMVCEGVLWWKVLLWEKMVQPAMPFGRAFTAQGGVPEGD